MIGWRVLRRRLRLQSIKWILITLYLFGSLVINKNMLPELSGIHQGRGGIVYLYTRGLGINKNMLLELSGIHQGRGGIVYLYTR